MGDIENKTEEWTGKVKEGVGDVTDNEDPGEQGDVDEDDQGEIMQALQYVMFQAHLTQR